MIEKTLFSVSTDEGRPNLNGALFKATDEGRTTTSVKHLQGEERLLEIARMLGGLELTEATREHAEEMLGGSQSWVPSA